MDQGVVFPKDGNGKRSTTKAGMEIVAAALGAASSADGKRARGEKNWRKNYRQYFERMTAAGVESAENARAIAQSGLSAVYKQFEFERAGQCHPLAAAMTVYSDALFETGIIHGTGKPQPLTIPYKKKKLSDDTLRAQLRDWQRRGIIEESHAAAVMRVIDNSDWLAALPAFVLMGAGAEIGPYRTLLDMGATVIAVDLDRADIWERLISTARQSAGTLIFPMQTAQMDDMSDSVLAGMAGANLISDTPEIITWLVGLDRPLTLGGYAYLDSGDFVRVAVAMDVIIKTVAERTAHPVNLAFLLTPTDVMAVPSDVIDAAEKRYQEPTTFRPIRTLFGTVTNSRLFARNVRRIVLSEEGRRYGIINSLVTQQGPNYTLAKRIQRWRSVVARDEGHIVSCNVAPATYTYSVTKNKLFMAGYAGAEQFGVEIFRPKTTNAIMTALLINDLAYEASASHPDVPLNNPEELFMEGANHGGMWRMANQLGSLIEVGVIVGSVKRFFSREDSAE
jgi:hypothetical protein